MPRTYSVTSRYYLQFPDNFSQVLVISSDSRTNFAVLPKQVFFKVGTPVVNADLMLETRAFEPLCGGLLTIISRGRDGYDMSNKPTRRKDLSLMHLSIVLNRLLFLIIELNAHCGRSLLKIKAARSSSVTPIITCSSKTTERCIKSDNALAPRPSQK